MVNKFLLTVNKFMPKMHLKQPGFTYCACGAFTKNEKNIQNTMQTGNTNYVHGDGLDKSCFQYNLAHGKYKDLTKRTELDKFLRGKTFKIVSSPKYVGCEKGLDTMVYKQFFDKKSFRIVVLNLCQINNLQINL